MTGPDLEKTLALQDAINRIFEKQRDLYADSIRTHGLISADATARYQRLDRLRSRLGARMWRLVRRGLSDKQLLAFDAAWDARHARQQRAYAVRKRLRERTAPAAA